MFSVKCAFRPTKGLGFVVDFVLVGSMAVSWRNSDGSLDYFPVFSLLTPAVHLINVPEPLQTPWYTNVPLNVRLACCGNKETRSHALQPTCACPVSRYLCKFSPVIAGTCCVQARLVLLGIALIPGLWSRNSNFRL